MMILTVDSVPTGATATPLGMVKGNVVRTKHVGNDIVANLRALVGGEVREYTSMIAGARQQAEDRMVKEAERLGADAIVGVRFTTSMVMSGASEILAFGTAVKLSN